MMNARALLLSLTVAGLPVFSGCGGGATTSSGGAAILGSIVPSGASGKYMAVMQAGCPEIVVTLNGAAIDVVLDDDCTFLVNDIEPAANVVLRVELPALGVSGTVELGDVMDAELIEIQVSVSDDSLSLTVERGVPPQPVDDLPLVIDNNNVTFLVPAGTYDQTLTVRGNKVTLVGQAGETCVDEGWTIITGNVLVEGNKATFRNIRFEGLVEIQGNRAKFINCCFGDELLDFGDHRGHGNDDRGDDDDDGDDDGDDD